VRPVIVLSADDAIHASIAAISDGATARQFGLPCLWGGAALFLWYHTVFAINRGTIEAAEGKRPTSAPALTRPQELRFHDQADSVHSTPRKTASKIHPPSHMLADYRTPRQAVERKKGESYTSLPMPFF